MINPMAFPMQNLLMGGMTLEDVQRKIGELKTVHAWLSTNLGMLELTIKTLEYQAALLTPANRSGKKDAKIEMPENPFLNPKNWPWPYGQTGESAKEDPAPKPESRFRAAAKKRSD